MNVEEMDAVQRKNYSEGREQAKILCNTVNHMGQGKEFIQGFIEEFCNRQHRTLQQQAGKVIYALLQNLAKKYRAKEYDLRNEALCSFADRVIDQFPDEYFPLI